MPESIHELCMVARPENAAETVDAIVAAAGAIGHSFAEFSQAPSDLMPDDYVDYGSEPFILINWEKVRFIRWLLDRYRHVVYADLDVGWLADPLWYLDAIATHFPLALQSEALRRFPPVLCWGFLQARSSDLTRELLDTMLRDYDARPPHAPLLDEQASFDKMLRGEPGLLAHVHPLSEALFVNGPGYRTLVHDAAAATPMLGRIEPFVFHANWTVGLDNKRRLMKQTGTWLIKRPGKSGALYTGRPYSALRSITATAAPQD